MKWLNYLLEYLQELWQLTLEMAPYLLLGFLFAGLLHVYLPRYRIQQFIGKGNLRSALYAGLLGVPLPLCSCGVIPTAVSFYKSGASKGSTVSFLISTPQTGLDSILVTYSFFGWPFALLRPIIALITGVFGGFLTNTFDSAPMIDKKGSQTVLESGTDQPLSAFARMKKMLNYAFVEFLNDISKWLVIGLLVAAFISIMVPDDFFGNYISNEFAGIFIMLLASVPMYVCATASVPIAAVLMMKGLSPGAALVFLMAGPATNMATIMVIGKAIGKRTLLLYLISITGGALFFGIVINEVPIIRQLFENLPVSSHNHVHALPYWLSVSSAVGLIILLINGFIKMKTSSKVNQASTAENNQVFLNVNGMSCSHCEANVEKNVASIRGVTKVKADFQDRKVSIQGKDIDLQKVSETINELGYEVVE